MKTTETTTEYAYDALGRRIGKYDAAALVYYNDQWQALTQEMRLVGQPYSVQRNYMYGNTIDEVLLMSDDIGRGLGR